MREIGRASAQGRLKVFHLGEKCIVGLRLVQVTLSTKNLQSQAPALVRVQRLQVSRPPARSWPG